MPGTKLRLSRFVTTRIVNPLARPLLERGLMPRGGPALLRRPGNDTLVRAVGTQHLVIRVAIDR